MAKVLGKVPLRLKQVTVRLGVLSCGWEKSKKIVRLVAESWELAGLEYNWHEKRVELLQNTRPLNLLLKSKKDYRQLMGTLFRK